MEFIIQYTTYNAKMAMDGIHNTPTHNDKMAMDGIHNTPIMPKWPWMEFIIHHP
jgi:hypothetical protein